MTGQRQLSRYGGGNKERRAYKNRNASYIKKCASYGLGANIKQSDAKLSVDARVMNHIYSLDGAYPENIPDYKPWNEPKLFLNANSELRKNVLLPVFSLQNGTGAIPCIRYDAHAANKGWLSEVCAGETAGTTGESRQLEAIRAKLEGVKGDIFYSAHVAEKGWLPYVKNGEIAGTTGESLRIEAIKMYLKNVNGYKILYRVHMAEKGWSDWVSDDAVAGTTGESRRIEAIEIKLIKQ